MPRQTRQIHATPFALHPAEDLLHTHPELGRSAKQLAACYAERIAVPEAHLKAIGAALWQSLEVVPEDFAAALAAAKAAGAAILPLSLHSNQAEVQALPWETLYHPEHGFLGQEQAFCLSRAAAASQASRELEQGPLRVLLFTSMPDEVDTASGRLNVEEEQAQVLEALLPWIAKGVVELEMPDDGQFSSLQQLMQDFQPHLLFLSGHGMFHYAPHEEQAPYGAFFFEDQDGKPHAVSEEELAKVFIGTGVQAVVLSACESAKTTASSTAISTAISTDLCHGLAQRISAQGIPFVIGMREVLHDELGIAFARSLCDTLARGERLDYALQAARRAMHALQANKEMGQEIGQWCLPILLASDARHALIDWNFDAVPPKPTPPIGHALGAIHLPERFIGRRTELRNVKNRLRSGKLKHLLLTGPGGQGKTALAGRLASDLLAHGWKVFAFSARPGNSWQEFVFEKLQMALDNNGSAQYDRYFARVSDEAKRAQYLYQLLQQQFGDKILLFLDNLETLQDPHSHALHDAALATWLAVAQNTAGWQVLATSRWCLPGWDAETESSSHLPLTRVNLGDFFRLAQRLALPVNLLASHPLRRVHTVLGGNCRGLEFFAGAMKEMRSVVEEEAFLEKLASSKSELQTDMAIEFIVRHLPENAYRLLQRLPNFAESVPIEGILKLGLDLPEAEAALQALLAVSLLEVSYAARWQVRQYQCSPLVEDWLQERGEVDSANQHLQAVADYQLYLFKYERKTLGQAIATHHALRRAKRDEEADRLTLDEIVGTMTMAGWYTTLLREWLPGICASKDDATRAEALGQTGKLHHHLGDYETALNYMNQSLSIFQHIGEKAGEGTTLNNISQIYKAQGDYDTALHYLKQSLSIRQQIGDKAGEGATLNNIAIIYYAQGDYDTALNYLKQALSIRQHIGDKAGAGATLNNISQIYQAQGDYDTALHYLKQSLSICQQIGDKAGEGTTLNNISQIYKAQGDYDTALNYLKQSLSIYQQIGDKAGEGRALNNISQIYNAQGDYDTALHYLKQSLSICQHIGDKAGASTTLNNISQIYDAQGDYDTALNYLKQSLSIYQQIGDKAGEGTTLNNIATIYQAQGDYDTALNYLKQSLSICQQIGDKAGESRALNNIATIYQAQGDYDTALHYLKQSLSIYQQIGDKAGEGIALNNIGSIYHAQGDYDTALHYLKQSLSIRQQIGDIAGLCPTLFNLGHIHLQNKQMQEALNAWVEAYSIAKRINLAQALQALAKLAPQIGLPPGLDGWEALAQELSQSGASNE